MNDQEHIVQKAIADYLNIRGLCWWAVPNGGNRNVITAKKLKSEGVKSGVPDITLIHDGMYFGIEVKKPKTDTPKGYLSANQKAMIKNIEGAGGEVGVAYSVRDVIELLIKWGI
jgi:Holliday junction resolvase